MGRCRHWYWTGLCRYHWNAVRVVLWVVDFPRVPEVSIGLVERIFVGWTSSYSKLIPPPTFPFSLHSSLKTRDLAFLTKGFVFVNIGATLVIIITLLATTGRENMQSASYIFTSTINETGWSSNSLAFMFGLLSVQWTVSA